jgi:hypothetical protein
MITNFVNISDYCVIEYRLTPLGEYSPELITSTFYKLINDHTSSRQIYNTDGYQSITRNTRDLSVVSVGGSKAIYLDPNLSPIYTSFDPLLTQTSIDSEYSSNLVFDTVRVHFASGFNFKEVENVVFGVKQTLNDLSQLQLASILLDAQTAQEIFTYNPQPLFLGNSIYDKYVELKVPSMPWMNYDFTELGTASFEYQITDGIGFIKNAPITVFFAEAVYEEYNAPNNITYDRYQINNYVEAPIYQNNKFDGLGCHIIEAEDGDYIEFFATWQNTFPDFLISSLNDSGSDQDWIITHQLQVYEHIGGSIVPAGNLIVYQENNFDLPLSYRPIIRNAGFAVAMSIDYTIRLLNRKTGEQVIRTGSLSVLNPNKYGRSLTKLSLPDGPQSMRVYNKIIQKNFETENIFAPPSSQVPAAAGSTANSTVEVVERFIPQLVPIKQENIRLSQRNALNTQGNEEDLVVYGQGRLTVPIDPTDNIIKFTVYQTDPLDKTKQSRLDLNNNSEFKLVFGKTTDFVFATVTDSALTVPSQGELSFRIPKESAKALLETEDNQFYIAIVSKVDGTESLLYTGKWTASTNYSDLISAAEDAETALLNEATISELQKQISELTAANEALQDQISAGAVAPSIPTTTPNINTAAAAGVNPSQTSGITP